MLTRCKTLFTVGLAFLGLSCSTQESILGTNGGGRFAVYIAAPTVLPYSAIQIGDLVIQPPAFLSASDITSYTWSEHDIAYPDSVWERLKTWGNLFGRIFVVTVGGERIYWGRFMDSLSSDIFQQPVITLIPRHPDGRNTTPRSLRIQRAYPAYFGAPDDPDPRNDPRIHDSLDSAGVLVP